MRDKINLVVLATLAYLIPFSARAVLSKYEIVGTNVVNDFSRVFLFAIDIISALAIGALFLADRNLNYSTSVKNNGFVKKSFIIFLIWVTISLISSPLQTFLGWSLLIRLGIAFALFLFVTKVSPRFSFLAVSTGLIIAGVVQSFIAITQFAWQKSLGFYFLGESPLEVGQAGVATFSAFGEKLLRAYGTLPHPNVLAFFLLISLLATLALHSNLWTKKLKIANTAAGTIISIGLILTFSRIFIILAAIAATIWFLVSKTYSKKYLGLSILAAISVFIGVLVLRPIENDTSLDLRRFYGQVQKEQIKQSPWIGTGLGQSVLSGNLVIQNLLKDSPLTYQTWLHQPVHNTYLLVASETGWVGFILFILFLIFLTDGVIKKIRQVDGASNPYFLFSAVATGVILVAMLFDHMFLTSPNVLYLSFIVFGLLYSAKNELAA